jgi:hypothetical protein
MYVGISIWSGVTRGALHYPINLDRFRPFVGEWSIHRESDTAP